jgi:aerobic carbon-monoxide dehydrogenase large subunit
MAFEGIGASVKRKEDARFLVGRGNYVDDINRPGQLYAFIRRSDRPHARIRGIDTKPAAAAPGVVAVYTGADMQADGIGGLPCGWLIHGKDGSPMKEPPHPVLAVGKVRHVGDPVAVVIAETKQQAKDAAELLDIDYEDLPAVASSREAAAPGAPLVHDEAAGNQCYDWQLGDKAAVDNAFASARHVVKLELTNNRLVPNAMEPRAAVGECDVQGNYTLYTTSQNPHVIRLLMGAFVLHLPEHQLRVVAPDVGGGFGSKIYHYAEEAIVTWAAGKLRRPVKWTAERVESFMSDAHGRDHVTTAEMAVDEQGTILALRVSTLANLGAYLSTFGPAIPTWFHATLLAGVYKTPAIYVEVKALFTNTVPVDAYRGAGRPEAAYILERLVDVIARDLGFDRVELRRRNFIPKDAFPYQTPVGFTYDSGDYEATLNAAIKAADVAGFEERRRKSLAQGKLRGLGYSTYVEACGAAPSAVAGALGARAGLYEVASIRVNPTGSVTVLTGAHSHGQGHETTFAQLVAEQLGVPVALVDIVHGDTARIPFGMGTYGSRSLPVGGTAMVKAMDKVIAKGKKIAAHLMEAADTDVVYEGGVFKVAGTDKSVPFAAVSLTAYVPHNFPHDKLEPGLNENAFYDPSNFTFPAGTYVCEVEVDPQTGVVRVDRFTAVDDFGNVVNPMVVEGQVHGGLAQGIGQALLEHGIYDKESGQLLTGSYMDYTMPRADDFCHFNVQLAKGTPCTHNPLGVKGCGEAGAIGSPPAVINAVCNAIGVKTVEMPATPHAVWQALRATAQ